MSGNWPFFEGARGVGAFTGSMAAPHARTLLFALLACALRARAQEPGDIDLLGPPKAVKPIDEDAVRRRRTMLQLHQGVGLGMFALELANTVVGQLNYSDKFAAGPNTGKYLLAHQITAYSTLVAFAGTGLLAVFAPTPIPRKPEGFDRLSLHKLSMGVATLGMASEAVLGIWAHGREGYLNQPDLAAAHLVIGYVTLAAVSLGVGAIVF